MKRLIRWFVTIEIAGNLAIFLAHRAARRLQPPVEAEWGHGALNPHQANEKIRRSGRPTPAGYRAASRSGVALIVDLRAEGGPGPDPALGLDVLHIPVRDGQAPTAVQVVEWREAVAAAEGPVLVHCAAGVGRTGSMVAAVRVLDDGIEPIDAMIEALAVGPPSLEQLAFVLGLPHRLEPPPLAVALSRVFDAPRRTWSRIRDALSHDRRS